MFSAELCLLSDKPLALVLLQALDSAAPRLSAAVLWAQLGEELQHLYQADYEGD